MLLVLKTQTHIHTLTHTSHTGHAGMMTWLSKERARYVDASHNACFYTVTNRPWYLLVACKPIAKGDSLRALLRHTASIHLKANFMCWVLRHIDTSLSLLLSTRYFCAGSLWHIKQLSAHQAAKCLQDGAEWLIFPTYMQISINIKFSGHWLIWNDCKNARAFFHVLQLICTANQPCAWIQHLISTWINGKPKINPDQPLLLDCWLNQQCGWIKQTSSWFLLASTINQKSTFSHWLRLESTVWLNQRNQQFISAWINDQPGFN